MEEKLKTFLAVSSGDGSGDGSGYGYGYGDGYGDGSGSGDGSGYGSGDGSGYGYGDGYGSGVSRFDGHPVAIVDDTQTVFYSIHGNVAKAAILQEDLTLCPCYIVKGGNCFAHGETLRKAQAALEQKLFSNMPIVERIQAFLTTFQPGQTYSNKLFFDWHNRLTGSCEMGRKAFAQHHNIMWKTAL